MILAYLDESGDRSAYYITALMVEDKDPIPLSSALDDVVDYAWTTYRGIRSNAELHGYDLAWGEGDWQAFRGNPSASVDVFERAIDAIAQHDVRIASRGVDLAGLQRKYRGRADPHGVVLTFALERVQWRARALSTVAIVIADEVGRQQAHYRRNFKTYQQSGTWGWRATVLDRLVDTIHFAPSNSSRLLQAADIVSYTRYQKDRSGGNARARQFYETQWAKLEPFVTEDSCWYP